MIRQGAAFAALLFFATAAAAVTFRYSSQDDPQSIDPHGVNLLAASRLSMNVYEPLVWRDRDWKVIPWLATSWSQPNEKVWRFKLREGVKFHDGTPLTAEDVVFSLQRVLAPTSQMRTTVQGVQSARAIDAQTVELVMSEPNPALLQHLTNFRIASKAWCVKNHVEKPQDYKNKEDSYAARNANGTGAFILREFQPDVKVKLEANREWWGRKAGFFESNIDEVVMMPIKSNATRLAALLSGEVDFVIDPPTQDVARLESEPKLKVLKGAEMRVQYLTFDVGRDTLLYGKSPTGKNPFKDLRVRQAVAHAIDADAIRVKVMRGMSKPIGSIISDLVAGFHPDGDKRLPYDREKAKKLLAEAGYPEGFDVTLDCGNVQPAADICQAVAAMLTQVGIRTRPNVVPQANYFHKIEKYDTSFYVLSWGGGVTSDALYTINALYHTPDNKGNGDFNLGRWSDPEMDRLIDRIKVEMDADKRSEEIRQALVLANHELPALPIHQPLIPWAMRKNVQAWFSPVNTLYFYRTRIE